MVPDIRLPPKLIPVFMGEAPVRGAWGGRGSAKTRSFALMAAVWGVRFAEANLPGVVVCARELQNSLDDSSFAEVKAAILGEPWLAAKYDIGDGYIRTKDKRISFVFCGLRHNLESIKSKSHIRLLWVDEGEPVTERAWMITFPTVREEGSELWVTWNPGRKNSATHKRFRVAPPTGAKIVEMNWRDNPCFPSTLEKQRLEDLEKRPDQYDHVWEGGFVSIADGAYYAKSLAVAKTEGRIGLLAADPLMTIRLFADIGGTGKQADAFTLWAMQFIGKSVRVLDYYEVQGQPIGAHVDWMRGKGYTPDRAQIWLPHDGGTHDKVYDVSYESELKAAGYTVTVVPNQGKGAAMMRVESARRLFPSMWFSEAATEQGREALGWYHEKKDEHRNVGLGPDHDWSSHGADSFGLACVVYEEPAVAKKKTARPRQSWMG